MARVFPAKFSGHCIRCGIVFYIGTPIVKAKRGVLHDHCQIYAGVKVTKMENHAV